MPGEHAAVDLAALRQEYGDIGLREEDAPEGPWALWEQWFTTTVAAGLHEPNAMVVATVDPDGSPSARMVLLKGVAAEGPAEGFTFFTNTASRKGVALAAQSACALLFPWHALERQVRVEGTARPVPPDEVAAYFRSRPRGAQLGAWASPQSQVIDGRADLERRLAETEQRFAEGDVPVPGEWGGYRVRPTSFEFWQGRRGRLHDRLHYARSSTGWSRTRLAP
ncbi:pyridoxamine 5'-phosphate oxidase [Nocardioides caeni]|uniref:Pyridoxine/pyridoxamine 5'-phosphate oxidase n=1 Tax=Nocardioides caeni TaxID=574700 RepID=A0A4S8NAS1_9ACTN|nr:pyridoxamine 5'-phosphate oxidase [Nocardioides caeni]THV12169.1 pyridoxamine 5'-phosphate oxidase [Nocardioides caeni]